MKYAIVSLSCNDQPILLLGIQLNGENLGKYKEQNIMNIPALVAIFSYTLMNYESVASEEVEDGITQYMEDNGFFCRENYWGILGNKFSFIGIKEVSESAFIEMTYNGIIPNITPEQLSYNIQSEPKILSTISDNLADYVQKKLIYQVNKFKVFQRNFLSSYPCRVPPTYKVRHRNEVLATLITYKHGTKPEIVIYKKKSNYFKIGYGITLEKYIEAFDQHIEIQLECIKTGRLKIVDSNTQPNIITSDIKCKFIINEDKTTKLVETNLKNYFNHQIDLIFADLLLNNNLVEDLGLTIQTT